MADQARQLEQDAVNFGHDLPTYDDLAQNAGPNSRFGRWRSWIEKRAAERYTDDPGARARGRARGWGEGLGDFSDNEELAMYGVDDDDVDFNSNEYLERTTLGSSSDQPSGPSPSTTLPSYTPTFTPLSSVTVDPCRLQATSFGSRFLPHVTAPPRTLLPVLSDRFLFVGHDDGLSVLDMFPEDHSDGVALTKGPDEAQARVLWEGESVRQLVLIEETHTGRGTPAGVVLALVGPSEIPTPTPKDTEWSGSLRMYNLSSLISLAKWSAQQRVQPLDLRKPEIGNPGISGTLKKHHKRHSNSLPKHFLSLSSDSVGRNSTTSSTQKILTAGPPSSAIDDNSSFTVTGKGKQPSLDSAWDVVDDLPLRWATDFVPLASPGSRLVNAPVLFFEFWRDPSAMPGTVGQTLLAVATKSAILLYETPKGQRSFRFVKEFYTPSQPKQISFVQQSVLDSVVGRRPSDAGPAASPRSSDSSSRSVSLRDRGSATVNRLQYAAHISLFILFDKKAGTIRLADSAVSEVELYDTERLNVSDHSPRKSKLGRDSGFAKESKPIWVPPAKVEVPSLVPESFPQTLYLLTKGKITHVLRAPLPAVIASMPPLRILTWKSHPSRIWARIYSNPFPSSGYPQLQTSLSSSAPSPNAYLQVTAIGDNGVETQELALTFLLQNRNKMHTVLEDVESELLRGLADVGGDAGYLTSGGHWHHLSNLGRSSSVLSENTTVESMDLRSPAVGEGVYGWVRKGLEDWRIIWLGPLSD